MAHYILSDDFDFDSIIIKSIAFDNEKAILKLVFTYNDGNTLETKVDLGDTFASNEYVATSINNALKSYSTTEEVGVQIANVLTEYDKSSVVTNKINEAIANALNDYYNKDEVNNKVANKNLSGVELNYNTENNSLNVKVSQSDGTSANNNVTIPNGSNSASGLISASQTKKLNNIEDGANKYVLPLASETALGGIMAETGDDNYTTPVKRVGNKLFTTPGQYDLKIASPTVLGGVKPTAVKTSIYNIAVAADSEGGLWTIAGSYILPTASADEIGGVKVGYTQSGKNYPVQLDSNNRMYVNVPWTDTTYTLPTATASVKGGVKIGSGINVTSDGTISAQEYSLPTASASTKGGVKTDGLTTGMQDEKIVVLTDGESIQAGTNGLEVKVDGTTIVKGENGLEANVKSALGIDVSDIIYSGVGTNYIYTTTEDCYVSFNMSDYEEYWPRVDNVTLGVFGFSSSYYGYKFSFTFGIIASGSKCSISGVSSGSGPWTPRYIAYGLK